MKNVIIIGGGPAGMIAAISSARLGNKVTIIEKMNSCGKKLLITGKGRCNITNNTNIDGFIENTPCNGRFLYGALNNFDNNDIIDLLEKFDLNSKMVILFKASNGMKFFDLANKYIEKVPLGTGQIGNFLR